MGKNVMRRSTRLNRVIVAAAWCAGAILPAALSTTALAQFRVTPGGANAGDGFFRQGVPATSGTLTGSSNAEFRPTTATSTDNMFGDQWWFRGPGDTREFAFANQPAGVPAQTMVTVGNDLGTLDTGGFDSTVTAASYAFTAQFRWRIVAGTGGPTVNYSATLLNTGTAPFDLSVFAYKDFDANGSAGTDTYSINGAGNTFSVADGPTSITWTANNPAAFQATAFATLRGLLANAVVDNLTNTVAGSPGDFTGAFQWNVLLAPAQPVTFGGTFSMVVPEPGMIGLAALGLPLLMRRRRA